MKLEKIIVGLLVASPVSLGAADALAAQVATKNSDAIIQFAPDGNTELPKDPNKPDDEVETHNPETGDKETPSGTPGPLSIDYASSFYFGTQKITLEDKNYYAKGQTVTKGSGVDAKTIVVPNYVQVTDKRGTGSGWNLTVKQNGQFKSTTVKTGTELTGAQLTFSNGNLSTVSTDAEPGSKGTIELLDPTAGAAQTVVNAIDGSGQGQWLYEFGKGDVNGATAEAILGTGGESVKLFVPGSANALADRYHTTLTWTLNDAPDPDYK